MTPLLPTLPALLAASIALPVEPATTCIIDGDELDPADTARALAACEVARDRFESLMGEPGPAVVILVEDRQWEQVLPHEIGHAMTSTFFYPEGRFRSTGYGTPLPDWFEEAMAIWMEPAAARDSRIEAARRLAPDRLDLPNIVTMQHPAAGNATVMAIRDGAAPPDEQKLYDFYQQSIAVLAFLHEAGGRAAIRELAFRLMAYPENPEAVVGLPGLPDRMDGVVEMWRAWLDD